MAGDYSRSTYSSLRDHVTVLLQQGHPITDADWNEFAGIVERRIRAGTVDTIGRVVVPRETPFGFEIRAAAGPTLSIGRGRMYVDGLLAENHGVIDDTNPPVFDRARLDGGRAVGVLDEAISAAAGDFVGYDAQPYLPEAPPLPDGGPHLVYLETWRREVTALKDPRLIEPALGGIDTATRWQTVWQVRVLPNIGAGASCATPDGELADWPTLVAPSAARLTTATIEFEDPDEPCLIPPGGGYRGLENQLYRVEIHSGTTLADARFKWSRENASVGAAIEAFPAGDRVQVRRIGRDSVLRFQTGDWVEVTDDRREFAGRAGDLRRVTVDDDANELTLDPPLSADLVPTGVGDDTAANRHSRVIRWDQSAQVRLADNSDWENLDAPASDGAIPVPTGGEAVVLEAGITVSFGSVVAGGPVRPGDYWIFAARTADASIEPLASAPPAGDHHHFARLAVVTFPVTVEDCRIFWPPEFGEGDNCACTECVSPEQHNTGQRTIQAAMAALPAAGGTVCLQPGNYILGNTPVVIAGRTGVRLRGHGASTVLTYAGAGGAVRVANGRDVAIDSFAVLAVGNVDFGPATAAIELTHCIDAAVTGITAVVVGNDVETRGVALRGIAVDIRVDDCLLVARDAVAAQTSGEREGPGYLALAELAIAENLLVGSRRGIDLDGLVLHLGAARICENLIVAGRTAINATGAGAGVAAPAAPGAAAPPPGWSSAPLHIERNWVAITTPAGTGIACGIPSAHIDGNLIVGRNAAIDGDGGALIALVPGLLPVPRADCSITGNRIGSHRGPGIRIDTQLGALSAHGNAIRDCGGAALTTGSRARIGLLAFENNIVERVAAAPQAGVAAGVLVAGVLDARINANRIATVGALQNGAALWAGIAVRGAARLDITGNSIAEIGPAAGTQLRIAVWIDPPVAMVTINRNHILSTVAGGGQSPAAAPWIAIGVFAGGLLAGFNIAAPPNALPVIVTGGNDATGVATAAILAADSFTAIAALPDPELSIFDNMIHSSHAGRLPIIAILLGRNAGTLLFNSNQVRLTVAGAMPALVVASAERIIACNNAVRRADDTDAMQLDANPFGQNPKATVIGNLVYGNIRLNGGNLPAEFAPLNVLAP